MIYAPINETLPATGAGAALVLLSGMAANDFAIQARGAVDMKISNVEALTTFYTIKSGTAIALSQILGTGADMFWAESGGAADTIEVLPVVK